MAEDLYRVELTASFLDRLDATLAFLTEADVALAFDALLAGAGSASRESLPSFANLPALHP